MTVLNEGVVVSLGPRSLSGLDFEIYSHLQHFKSSAVEWKGAG